MNLYEQALRPLLFRLDAETAHRGTIAACQFAGHVPGVGALAQRWLDVDDPRLSMEIGGITFARPVGLAAGWDKSGRTLKLIDRLGFGFAEIGSISARPSEGNPKPRLFRVAQDQAIVVNYGLPNDGVDVVSQRVAQANARIPIGVNLVKTNDGPGAAACGAEEIIEDYVCSISLTHQHADYLMLNLSCPNAKDGQDFFTIPGNIGRLLAAIKPLDVQCPVFLKLPPTDESARHDRWLCETDPFEFVKGFMFNLAAGKPDWIRLSVPPQKLTGMPGAVAGKPVQDRMQQCVAALASRMDRKRYQIIGGGGVFTGDDAWRLTCLGASLIQIYTAFVYQGPIVTRRIHLGLLKRIEQHGFDNLSQAVGSAL